MNLLRYMRELVDSVTMYRLTFYGLAGISTISVLFGAIGRIPYSAGSQLLSLIAILGAAYIANRTLSIIKNVPINSESWLITSLILFLILPPVRSAQDVGLLMLTAIIAMASKFILVYRRKNIFNPAAVGAAILVPATWWVGSSVLLPFTALFAAMLLLKLRLFRLFFAFALVALAASGAMAMAENIPINEAILVGIVSGPLIFLGSVMLTEPSTLPPTHGKRLVYGALVGLLFALHPRLAGITLSPEVALLIGNLFAFAVGSRYRLKMKLIDKRQLSPTTYEFVFSPERPFTYKPGQYMEWTLPHRGTDIRGNRRSFSLASSPTETSVRIGVKIPTPSSSYKQALLQLKPGQSLYASHVVGDFTLPQNLSVKYVFIAGGIGVTPFRSIIKYLLDSHPEHLKNIIVVYITHDAEKAAYLDILREAGQHGLEHIPADSTITAAQFSTLIPDLTQRTAYISGPSTMVEHYKTIMKQAGVGKIQTDHFSGY